MTNLEARTRKKSNFWFVEFLRQSASLAFKILLAIIVDHTCFYYGAVKENIWIRMHQIGMKQSSTPFFEEHSRLLIQMEKSLLRQMKIQK